MCVYVEMLWQDATNAVCLTGFFLLLFHFRRLQLYLHVSEINFAFFRVFFCFFLVFTSISYLFRMLCCRNNERWKKATSTRHELNRIWHIKWFKDLQLHFIYTYFTSCQQKRAEKRDEKIERVWGKKQILKGKIYATIETIKLQKNVVKCINKSKCNLKKTAWKTLNLLVEVNRALFAISYAGKTLWKMKAFLLMKKSKNFIFYCHFCYWQISQFCLFTLL